MKEKVRKIRRFAPCSICDVERLESWLTDMAAQGWHLKEVTFRQQMFVFEAGEAKNVRYRLEAGKRWGDDEKPEYTAQKFFADCGWESVSSYGRFFIFRSLTPDAPELNTDPAVQLMSMKWLRRKVVTDLLFTLLMMAVLLALLWYRGFQYLMAVGLIPLAICLVAFLTAGVEFTENITRANAFVKRLKTNDPLDHSKPWKKGALYHQASTAVCAVAWVMVYAIWAGSLLVSCGKGMVDGTQYQQFEGEVPVVTMAGLCEGSGYTLKEDATPAWSETDTSAGYTLDWTEGGSFLSPDGETYGGYMRLLYHETAAEWIAKGLTAEYLRELQKEHGNQEQMLPELDVDFAAAYWNCVIIRDGNVVIKARIPLIGENDSFLILWAEKMAEMLKE